MASATPEVQNIKDNSNIGEEATTKCNAPSQGDSAIPPETDAHVAMMESAPDDKGTDVDLGTNADSQEGREKKNDHGGEMIIDLCLSEDEEKNGAVAGVSNDNMFAVAVDSDDDSDTGRMKISELKTEGELIQNNSLSIPTKEEREEKDVSEVSKDDPSKNDPKGPQDGITGDDISEKHVLEMNPFTKMIPSSSHSPKENTLSNKAQPTMEGSTSAKRDSNVLGALQEKTPAAKKPKNGDAVLNFMPEPQEVLIPNPTPNPQMSGLIPAPTPASEKGEIICSVQVSSPKTDSQSSQFEIKPNATSSAQAVARLVSTSDDDPKSKGQQSVLIPIPKPGTQAASASFPKPETQSVPSMSPKNTSETAIKSSPLSVSVGGYGAVPTSTPVKVPDSYKTVGARVISESVATEVNTPPSVQRLPVSPDKGPSINAPQQQKLLDDMSSTVPSANSSVGSKDDKGPICDPTFASLVKLDPVKTYGPLPLLSARDIAELESSLQIGERFNNGPDDGWRDDWSGNIQLIDKELIMNRDKLAQNPQTKPITMPFCEYVSKNAKNSDGLRGLSLLLSYVYHMKGTPAMAKKLLAHALQRPAKGVDQRLNFIVDAVKRISYDPTVLTQDGWTTVKSESPQGASGGAFLIGRRVIWHRFEAIVIAYVHDDEIGDLWKAMWLEDQETFDLEADELQEALQKWEKKQKKKEEKAMSSKMAKPLSGGSIHKAEGTVIKPPKTTTSRRFSASTNFTVDGIEHGIILATPLHPNARIGVVWPARVMHVSEIKALGTQQASRRSSSKNSIHVVFLAPYWNGHYSFTSKNKTDLFMKNPNAGKDAFSAGPLFEMETVEVSETTIQKYPYDDLNSESLSIDNLRSAFRFLGLPKAAFPRFLDSHRLAMSLKTFARREISKTRSSENDASHATAFAALTDTHTLSVRTAMFPNALLILPYDHILSNLPPPTEQVSQLGSDDGVGVSEPVLKLHLVMKAMAPPHCWGNTLMDQSETNLANSNSPLPKGIDALSTPDSGRGLTPINSPDPKLSSSRLRASGSSKTDDDFADWSPSNFASGYLLNHIAVDSNGKAPTAALTSLGNELDTLLSWFRTEFSAADKLSREERENKLEAFLCRCLVIKGYGEDLLALNDVPKNINCRNLTLEWRKTCERIFKRAIAKFSVSGFGNGVTVVLTDSRCNQHLTATGSFERAVRLPAAIRGAKQAGAGSREGVKLVTQVDEKYMELAEKKILPKAHKASYLKRIKAKIAALPPDAKGAPLTDDSEGEGGEDTMGSRGSYTAAVAGIAAALQAVNMVVGGKCVNVFCAVRPPGHHAGRDLRPMNAISNGFCLLNAAACAALYATAPQSEGGLGLKRVCVIDFDVHHGNGTQDILCSTHDSRFLYVSLHAGGAHINGYDDGGNGSETDDNLRRSLPGGGKNEGIFPGRCGDTSPHEGVLNIPLGQKVTAQAIGNALVSQVSPAVEAFSPELIVLSAGFDAHKHDPLGMGGLSAEDFGSVTDVACQMAFKSCSGRVLSILEGGYGVPCCRIKNDLFLPNNLVNGGDSTDQADGASKNLAAFKILDLGDDLPTSMEDDVPIPLQQKLDRCHAEGFLECVKEHVSSLSRCNGRMGTK